MDDLCEPSAFDPLGPLVESYLARWRNGDRPTPEEYAGLYSGFADRILSLFPAIGGLEQLAGADPGTADAPNPLPVRRFPAPFGRYDLLLELGRGGMGVVYQAWDRDARRVVALKVIRPGTLEDARFSVEAGVLARLEHDNVVPLYEVGEHEGGRYFTMRFVEGGDLTDRLAEFAVPIEATRSEAEEAIRRIAGLMAKVARAVGYVHRRGVLHRDLKPGNILIDRDGRPVVSDFGLARRFAADALAMTLVGALSEDPESWSGRVVGTFGYMAPEQAAGRGVLTTAADLFSLGAILYRLLAGGLPFGTDSPSGLFSLLDPQHEATRPSMQNPAVPAGCDLEWICLTCLAKDPCDRYATADTLADDLDRVARGEPISRPDRGWSSRVLRMLKWRRRHSDDRTWGQVEMIEALLNLSLHVGLFGLIRTGASAPACWSWYLAFEAATWWVFLGRLYRGRRTEASERDLLSLWVGISLAGLTLFALYCPPTGNAGSAGLLRYYPPWAVVTGLGLFFIGRVYMGGLYLLGIGFFLLAMLMPLTPEFAPLEYGVLFALGLFWVGRVHSRAAGTASTMPRD